jgi:hypothetical protein
MSYFKIIPSNDPDRIEVDCGRNGHLTLIRTDVGMVVDVYANGNDDGVVATMSVWDVDMNNERDWTDDLSEDEQPNVCKTPTAEEMREYYKNWGQKHSEICANLGYDKKTADDLLMVDYFWLQSQKEWYPKISSVYSNREQEIADHLRNNS